MFRLLENQWIAVYHWLCTPRQLSAQPIFCVLRGFNPFAKNAKISFFSEINSKEFVKYRVGVKYGFSKYQIKLRFRKRTEFCPQKKVNYEQYRKRIRLLLY